MKEQKQMARALYNHSRKIQKFQTAIIKSILPGMIIDFKYNGKNIFDKKPMVLVFWVDN